MRLSILVSFFGLFALAACKPAYIRFSAARPLTGVRGATPLTQKASPPFVAKADGYLRFYVSTELGALERESAFDGLSSDIQFLSVNLETKFPGSAPVEYPLAKFDVANRSVETVAGFDVGRAQYIDLSSGFQTLFSFRIRAIPKQFATVYSGLLSQLEDVATPISKLASLSPQAAPAASMLTTFMEKALENSPIPNVSLRQRTVGLTNAADAVLPLDGTPVVVFLVRADEDSAALERKILNTDYRMCTQNSLAVCSGNQDDPIANLPYILIRAELVDRRPMTDFKVPDIDCDVSDDEAKLLDEVLSDRTTALSPKQRERERTLFARLETLVALRALSGTQNNLIMDRLARLAYRNHHRRHLSQDAVWERLYEPRSRTFERCYHSAISAQKPGRVKAWKTLSAAFESAGMSNGERAEAQPKEPKGPGAETSRLEKHLTRIRVALTPLKITTGETFDWLDSQRSEIERELARRDSARLKIARTGKPTDSLVTAVEARQGETSCSLCLPIIAQTLAVLGGREVTPDLMAAKVGLDRAKLEAAVVLEGAKGLDVPLNRELARAAALSDNLLDLQRASVKTLKEKRLDIEVLVSHAKDDIQRALDFEVRGPASSDVHDELL